MAKERWWNLREDLGRPEPAERARWGAGVLAVAAICWLLSAASGGVEFLSELALILAVVGLGALAMAAFGR